MPMLACWACKTAALLIYPVAILILLFTLRGSIAALSSAQSQQVHTQNTEKGGDSASETFHILQDGAEEAEYILKQLETPMSVSSHSSGESSDRSASIKDAAETEENLILRDLRDKLAWEETKRDVPAAVDAYFRLYQRLEEHLASEDQPAGHARPARSSPHESHGSFADLAGGGHRDGSALDMSLAGLAEATFDLAVMTLTGLAGAVLPQNKTLGMHLLHQAAAGGSIAANLALSNRYQLGWAVPEDCDTAMRYGKVAAEFYAEQAEAAWAVSSPAEPVLLRERWRDAGYVTPLPTLLQWETQAGQVTGWDHGLLDDVNLFELMLREIAGDAVAMEWLHELPLDESEQETTLQALVRLAVAGDAGALYNLGLMHHRGINVDRNETAAHALFSAAAARGVSAAYNALGVMYYGGEHLPQNHSLANRLFMLAAQQGNADGHYNLGAMHAAGHGVEEDPAQALEHFKEAHHLGHWKAPFQLALAIQEGLGTAKDCQQAAKYLNTFIMERAPWHNEVFFAVESLDAGDEWKALVMLAHIAEQGSVAAQHNLAFTLERSKSFMLPTRFGLAYNMYLRAGKAGFSPGLTDAAHMVWQGHKYQLPSGTNRTRGLELYEQAAALNDTEALFCLAWAHQAGAAARRNTTRAAELYWQAMLVAPSAHHGAAPFLALLHLKLQSYQRAVTRPLARLARRIVHWDLAVLTAFAVILATILWLKRQRQRQRAQQEAQQRQHST